jgi:hypothetical protein
MTRLTEWGSRGKPAAPGKRNRLSFPYILFWFVPFSWNILCETFLEIILFRHFKLLPQPISVPKGRFLDRGESDHPTATITLFGHSAALLLNSIYHL